MPLDALRSNCVLSGAAYQRDCRRDANAASAPPAAPSANADGTPIRAALRAVRKSRISQPRSRARARRRASGLMATAVPDQRQHGHVVEAVGVGGAAFEVEPLADRQRPHRVRLAGAVQDVADQPAGEHPVDRFGDRAQRAGQPQPARDGRGELVGRGGDEPHLLAGVEMHLGQLAGAGPDLVGDDLVVDLLAER